MVVFSGLRRALSWMLGKLDRGYYFLGIGRPALKFFEDGFGDVEETLRLLEYRGELAKQMVSDPTQVPEPARKVIQELAGQQVELEAPNTTSDLTVVPGRFESPLADWLPKESKQCIFHILKPPAGVEVRGVCILLPHTADQGKTARRKLYGDAIAKKGVVCIILIAPFYGVRKPAEQHKWFLRKLHDNFLQAMSIAVEAACLLHWAKQTWGARVPLATAGLSFGGAMAGLSAKMYNGPVAIVPYLGCLGPGEPFTEGVFNSSIAWDALDVSLLHNHPLIPPVVLSGCGREDLSHLSADEAAFCSYCRFATDTQEFKDALPASSWGQCVLYMVQARDDDFVPYKEGKALYDTLMYLTEGSLESTDGSSAGSGKVESEVQSSEFVTISGGHCTGFVKAPFIMPDAVLTALERLRTKHSM